MVWIVRLVGVQSSDVWWNVRCFANIQKQFAFFDFESKSLIMTRLQTVIFPILLSSVFSYGGYHVPSMLPEKQRNWLENIIDNLHGKSSTQWYYTVIVALWIVVISDIFTSRVADRYREERRLKPVLNSDNYSGGFWNKPLQPVAQLKFFNVPIWKLNKVKNRLQLMHAPLNDPTEKFIEINDGFSL